MFSELRCPLMEGLPELDEWVFICKECLDTKLTFLNQHPDGLVPQKLRMLVDELRVEHAIDVGGAPGKDPAGFRIPGGRWVSKAQFLRFSHMPEFAAEFGPLNTADEDQQLPPAHGQAEYAHVFREIYRGLFETLQRTGRTVVQSSDVRAVLRSGMNSLFHAPPDPPPGE
jgi:hypothetical protein